MSQLFLTTNNAGTYTINDLGAFEVTHPVVNKPLLIPDGPFTKEEIQDSADLQTIITAGDITITDIAGTTIDPLDPQAETDVYVKVSINDSTPDTLLNKIGALGDVVATEINDGGQETIQLDFSGTASIDADQVTYDPTGTSLTATDVQAAVTELWNESANSFLSFGTNNNQTATGFLRNYGRGDFSNLNPQIIPYDIEVVAVVASNRLTETDGFTIRIFVNGVVVPGFDTVVAAASNRTENILGAPIAISAGDEVSCQFVENGAGDNIARPKAEVWYRRTA